jgi:hypothetical protein
LMCSLLVRVRPTVSSSPALAYTVPVQGPLMASKERASYVAAALACQGNAKGLGQSLTAPRRWKANTLPWQAGHPVPSSSASRAITAPTCVSDDTLAAIDTNNLVKSRCGRQTCRGCQEGVTVRGASRQAAQVIATDDSEAKGGSALLASILYAAPK